MTSLLSYLPLPYKRIAATKQRQQKQYIASLPAEFHQPLSKHDIEILSTPSADLVRKVHSGQWSREEVFFAHARQILHAHEQTNCLTELMLLEELSRIRTEDKDLNRRKGPFEGVVFSVKDTASIENRDSTVGYAEWCAKPAPSDCPLVKMIKDAGGIVAAKTNVPASLLSFESTNRIWGTTTNPFSRFHISGGSSGGCGALVGAGGVRLAIGTDVAGSCRVPSSFCGVYTLKSSQSRIPRSGNKSGYPGMEGVMDVYSPLARSYTDLRYFYETLLSDETGIRPWDKDSSVSYLPWRGEAVDKGLEQREKVRWGVLVDDGVCAPTPAVRRAVELLADRLAANPHNEVVQIDYRELPVEPSEMYATAVRLLTADGGRSFVGRFWWGEIPPPGLDALAAVLRLPKFFKSIVSWIAKTIWRDELLGDLVAGAHAHTAAEQWEMVVKRDECRMAMHKYLTQSSETKVDFLITPVFPSPALLPGQLATAQAASSYTLLYNFLDLPSAVVPVTTVDTNIDGMSDKELAQKKKGLGAVARGLWRWYRGGVPKEDGGMGGLPVGVQVVGTRRQGEEEVSWGVGECDRALGRGEDGRWEGGVAVVSD